MNEEEAKELLKKLRFSSDEYYIVDGAYAKNIDYLLIENAIKTVLNLLEKKDKMINEIEDLCIRKGDDESEEYGGVIIWNFAHKIMDIIKKGK